jgi:signal peptide peptidase SppA
MIEYRHVVSRFFNQPLLLERAQAASIGSFLLSRMSDLRAGKGRMSSENDAGETRQYFEAVRRADGSVEAHSPRVSRFYGDYPRAADGSPLPYRRTADGAAIMTLIGEWVNRGAWVGASSGLISYEGFTYQMRMAAADPQVTRIILDMESPGGEAVGCFEAAAVVREVAKNKPVTVVVNGMAASAAYAIASGASRIVTLPTGLSGSVGVVLMHLDYSQWLENEGVKPTLVFAGDHKVDGNPFEPLPAAVREDMQAGVDSFYRQFVETVAAGRKMSAAAVRNTQARVFNGQDAVAAGLADAVGTFEDVLFSTSDALSGQKKGVLMSDNPNAAVTESTAPAVSAAPAAVSESAAPDPAAVNTAALTAERARAGEISTLAIKHKMPESFAAEHIAAGSSLETVRGLVLAHVVAVSDKQAISARTPPSGSDRAATSSSWDKALSRVGAAI